MKKIQIQIPSNERRLEEAFLLFVEEEFNTKGEFKQEKISEEIRKDLSITEAAWMALQFFATVEGSLQFSERLARVERVKKLLNSIEKVGKSVYIKIGETDVLDLLGMSVDDLMDIL